MFQSLIRAKTQAFCKIMLVALPASIGTLMFWTSLIMAIAMWRVEPGAVTAHAPATSYAIEPAKRTPSATVIASSAQRAYR